MTVIAEALQNSGQAGIRRRAEDRTGKAADLVRRWHVVRREPVAGGLAIEILAVLDPVGAGEDLQPRVHFLSSGIRPP